MIATSLLIAAIVLAFTPSISLSQDPLWRFSDAEILALEISGELLPPPSMVAQVDVHLTAIKQYAPFVADIHARPAWPPGELLVRLTQGAFELYQQGQYHSLDWINQYYGPVEVSVRYGTTLLLTFERPYNPTLLANDYEQISGVDRAYPIGIIGDGNDIWHTYGTYFFRRGWGDCPAGCTSQHTWAFLVGNGVALVGEWGDPLAIEPTTWGEIKSHYRSPRGSVPESTR